MDLQTFVPQLPKPLYTFYVIPDLAWARIKAFLTDLGADGFLRGSRQQCNIIHVLFRMYLDKAQVALFCEGLNDRHII